MSSYRTIAVHVNESGHSLDRAELAAGLALKNEAHLIGVATTGMPAEFYMPLMVDGAVVLAAYLEMRKKQGTAALSVFESAANKAGAESVEKRMIEEEPGSGLCLQARYSDLLIIGQTDPDESLQGQREDLPEYIVMNSGRPVLIVPYSKRFDTVGTRVVAAWDGSLGAARAISAALPFLRCAGKVDVLLFNPEIGPNAHGQQPGADIALYLARHGVNVEVVCNKASDDVEIGTALLSYATEHGIDLLVMGCYGHSRLREILLGGVTRAILRSMTVPVLMSH